MWNQNQQPNPYQQGQYQNPNPNNPNAYNNNNPNGYPNMFGGGNNPQMNLFNPANFRGSLPNQQEPNPYYANKLADDQYYSESLEESARKGFISKVYLLLSIQLLLTTLIGYIAYGNETFKKVFIHPAMIIIVSVSLLAVTLVMACCQGFFRKHALLLFSIFTVLMSILVAISICAFKSNVILMAVGMTLFLTIALTIYAWKTESDLTGCGVYLMIIGLVLLIFGIVAIFWKDPIVHLVYSCLAAFLFSIYLVYDTQLVIGRKKYSYSLDDTYMAAIQLYTDIIQIFLNLVQILAYFNR